VSPLYLPTASFVFQPFLLARWHKEILIVREAEAMMLCLDDLKIWLSLETPIIEDGNSFGADVQSHINDEINKQHNRANQYQGGCIRHHRDRCLQVKEWAMMPNVADHAARIASVSH
jgi:hypothetical protein